MVKKIEELLSIETSRRNTDMLADLIYQKPELFDEFVAIFLRDEEPVSRRAAWVVDTVSEKFPELLFPYLPVIVEKLSSFSHDALKRHSVRMLSRSPLPHEKLGPLMNICFDWLTSAMEPVAVKVWCMEILYRISQSEPDLRKELADSIEWRMEEETAGFRNRGMKILKKLNKEMIGQVFLQSGIYIPRDKQGNQL
jgi:hypothetical protein